MLRVKLFLCEQDWSAFPHLIDLVNFMTGLNTSFFIPVAMQCSYLYRNQIPLSYHLKQSNSPFKHARN